MVHADGNARILRCMTPVSSSRDIVPVFFKSFFSFLSLYIAVQAEFYPKRGGRTIIFQDFSAEGHFRQRRMKSFIFALHSSLPIFRLSQIILPSDSSIVHESISPLKSQIRNNKQPTLLYRRTSSHHEYTHFQAQVHEQVVPASHTPHLVYCHRRRPPQSPTNM